MKLLMLGSLVLSLSSFAAVLSFGPEVPLSQTGPQIISSATSASSPAIATNGDGFLAAWSDSRDQQGFYATRVDADGHIIDQPSFFVSAGQGPTASTGIGRDTLLAVAPCYAIDLFRIDENRNVVASAHIPTPIHCWDNVSIATNGNTVVVVYTQQGSGVGDPVTSNFGERGAAVLDASLNVKYEFPINASESLAAAAVASNGTGFAMVTAGPSPAATVTQLDASGTIMSSHSFVLPNNVNSLAIASNGDEYLALAGGPVLAAQRINAEGSPIDAANVVHVAVLRPVSGPRLTWDGAEYIATYEPAPLSSPALSAAVRLDAGAQVLGEQSLGGDSRADVAIRDGRAAVLTTGVSVNAQILSTANLAALTPPTAVSTSAAAQSTPKLVDANGTLTYFWREGGSLKAKIESGNEVKLVDSVGGEYSAGFDGTNYVVVWQTANEIHAQRFAPNLAPLDPAPLSFNPSSAVRETVAAVADGRALVAWAEGTPLVIKATAIDTTKTTMAIPPPVLVSSLNTQHPAVAWNGTDFAIVCANQLDFIGDFLPFSEVVARHITRDGAIASDIINIATNLGHVASIGVAGDFAAWTLETYDPLVFGKRIRAAGNAVVIGPNTATGGINVATYRDGYVVAWPAEGSTSTTYTPALRLVDADGAPGAMYATGEVPHGVLTDDVAFASGVMVYLRATVEPQYGGVSRLFVRTFAPQPHRHATGR
jgi:hypothetical protein